MDNGTDEWSGDEAMPNAQLSQLLADLGQVGADLAEIMETLEDWPQWYEEQGQGRGTVLQGAYTSLLEATREIHTTAAMLHLLASGSTPPEGLLVEEE
ncbi:MAG TPA: hypothetical protein VF898_13310 [Chloroflexota bacterium]